MSRSSVRRRLRVAMTLLVVSSLLPAVDVPDVARAADGPTSVTIVGSLQSELGCPGDWQPECEDTRLALDATDGVWQATFTVPAGSWEYKAALNGSWDENYGANATPSGANISLSLASETALKFYYDPVTHWVTDAVTSVIATAVGSFQSGLGCPGDWQPECLRSWLEDIDGDGIHTFVTSALPPGHYEAKVAIDEGWAENYGAGGVANGANVPFDVLASGSEVTFTYASTTHVLSVAVKPSHGHDGDVEWLGLGHDSRDPLYRAPSGAIPAGTTLTLRLRTYHDDVTGVRVRLYDGVEASERFLDMSIAAADVSCYDPAAPEERCDFWEAQVTPSGPTTLYYRFIVTDGLDTDYYDDDGLQDGGWGEPTDDVEDDSFAVTVYDPSFEPVGWLRDAVVYQIFPDRFRNGRASNDPTTDEPRYGYPEYPESDDRIVLKDWDDLPEGYCRSYTGVTCDEQSLGRDYFGGDLRGVAQRLNYLEALGVDALYFNPVFDSASNHGYDTQDYRRIDPFFGTERDFDELVQQAGRRGIRVILDGVFNHVSSDSPYFDRPHHYETLGACEGTSSPYRSWFFFDDAPVGVGPCVGSDDVLSAFYESWFGFDTLPVLDKSKQEVKDLVYAGADAVASLWLERGAAGWRLDVPSEPSFPAEFWPEFREVVKDTSPDAVIIGELWKKHDVLPYVRGDRMDAAMNYRLRNAVLGLFGTIDFKGFPDDGLSDQPPSVFAGKVLSIREDNPDASWFNMLNLLDSHDTQRILWALTPGENNREAKELDAANVARGKALLRLATVVQMTLPGAPMIYYGDEVGVTGADDPDCRRTFPWWDDGPYGVGGDLELLEHYRHLTRLRHAHSVFRRGALGFLLSDDASRTLAYLMRTEDDAAIVALNRSETPRTLVIDASGRVPDAARFVDVVGASGTVVAEGGVLTLELPALSAAVLLAQGGQDLVAPEAPNGLVATEGNGTVGLVWQPVGDAARTLVYRSPLHGGGFVLLGEAATTSYEDATVENGRRYVYVVRAVDAAGNVGEASADAEALPHLPIGWANLQWPPTISYVLDIGSRTAAAYGQVWIDGATQSPGPTPSLRAQLGFGPTDAPPSSAAWRWVEADFNVDAGNNDEFVASLAPEAPGAFHYAYRYTTTGGREWLYADLGGPADGDEVLEDPGLLTVTTTDTTPPAVPTGLHVVSTSLESIELAWDAVPGDATLYGYEVGRGSESGGPFETVARVTSTGFTDADVTAGATYWYVVRSVDGSYNRSVWSAPAVSGTASARTVAVTFTVTVPDTTDATGLPVHIAGTLSHLDPSLPDWNPAGVVLTRLDATHWSVTLSGPEGTSLEYKYALGSWDFVEKGASCEELGNRTLTLVYGSDGTHPVDDTVANWRNVAPCGN